MRNKIILAAATMMIISSCSLEVHAQCSEADCNTLVQLPITDVNGFNNQQGSKCIQGNGTFGNNLNLNNWSFVSFQGNVNVQQTININTGQKVYLAGNINLSNFSMAGGNDSAIIYVSDNSNIVCNNTQNPNNTHNYVFLGNNSTFTMSGVNYTPGMTYQGPGNSTNVVHFLSCSSNVALDASILKFYLTQDVLKWLVDTKEQIEIQYSDDSKYFKTINYTYQNDGGMILKESGFYRLKVEGKYSTIIPYNMRSLQPNPKRLLLYEIGNLKATKIIK